MLSLIQGRRAFGLCALFLSLLYAQTPQQAEVSRRAKDLMAAGKFGEAVPLYQQLVREVPGNPGLLANLAMAQHMAGQDREAIEGFTKVLKVQPGAYPALMMSAVSYMRLGEPAKAVPLFERGLAIQPKDLDARRMLADALLMLKRHEAAASQLRNVTAATPQDAKAWYGLGRSYELLAQSTYESMLKSHPESPYTVAITADARLRQQKYSSAFALYKRAGEVPGVHTGLAEIYEKNGKPEWAATERAREKKPACAKPTLACDFQAGRHAAVVQASKARQDGEGLFWRIRAYNELALAAFRKLTALPASPELNEVMAELYRTQGRYKESIAAWEEAMRLAPGDPRLPVELATTVYLSRDYARAESLLRDQVRRDPRAADMQFMLGDSILNQQRAAEAIPYLRRALDIDPAYVSAHASLARSYTQAGEPEKAIPHLERALPVDTDGALHYQLARAYQSSGRAEEAKKLLVRYQELQREAGQSDVELTAP